MKGKGDSETETSISQFELKYCERCGGLWLRPAGGGQIYCKSCGMEMAKLPQVSLRVTSMFDREGWDDGEDIEAYQEGNGLDVVGGEA